MDNRKTYIRKISRDTYEYGFVVYAERFRKQADIYTPVGTTASIGQAQAARAALPTHEGKQS